jgi:hypothetical protein
MITLTSPTAGLLLYQAAGRLEAVPDGKAGLCVDDLPAVLDLEQPILGGVVADWDVTAPFKPVGDGAPIFPVKQPVGDFAFRLGDELSQSNGVRTPEIVEDIGELGVLRRAVDAPRSSDSSSTQRTPSSIRPLDSEPLRNHTRPARQGWTNRAGEALCV